MCVCHRLTCKQVSSVVIQCANSSMTHFHLHYHHDLYRRRHNNELYKHNQKITDTIKKRRIAFYVHLQRMNNNRLTETIFKYITKLKMANTWINETESDIEELQITHDDITKRIPRSNKLHNFEGFQENPGRKTGAV